MTESNHELLMQASGKLHGILSGIRQEIRQGVLPAGSRLPTRSALARRFRSSDSTVQAAIRVLVAEGSVVTRKRAGSFIAAQPPECCRFALVMPEPARSAGQPPTYFLDCLAAAAPQIARLRPGWRMEFWQSADPSLAEAVRHGALAGILYFGSPERAPAVAGTGIPLATFILPGLPAWAAVNIMLDNRILLERSLRSHLDRGRRRIGVLDNGGLLIASTAPSELAGKVRPIAEAVRRAGGTCKTSWIHCLDPCNPVTIYQLCLLLLDRLPAQRPEALVLLDDHLLPPVLTAIRDLGLRIPGDLSVSVQAHRIPDGAPDGCIRLGFEAATFMAEIVDRLARCRQGVAGPQIHHPRIEELDGPATQPRRRRAGPQHGPAT